MSNRLYTKNSVADYLGVSLQTVNRLLDNGILPRLKIGRLVRVREKDLLKFIETGIPAYKERRPV